MNLFWGSLHNFISTLRLRRERHLSIFALSFVGRSSWSCSWTLKQISAACWRRSSGGGDHPLTWQLDRVSRSPLKWTFLNQEPVRGRSLGRVMCQRAHPSGLCAWPNAVKASVSTLKILAGRCRDSTISRPPETSLACKLLCLLNLTPTSCDRPLSSVSLCSPCTGAGSGCFWTNTEAFQEKLIEKPLTFSCPNLELCLRPAKSLTVGKWHSQETGGN